jgi:hypothetical protein
MSEYIVEQDLYESDDNFELRIILFKLIQKKFPSIRIDAINVITTAYIKKLRTGEIFTQDIEKIIKQIKI